MKEAAYYIAKGDQVICQLCPHACSLSNDEFGKCRVRQNVNGRLITWSYGNVSAFHVDPVEKKPLFHFLPGSSSLSLATNGCVLSCLNCQNWEISQSPVNPVSSRQISPAEVIDLAVTNRCESLSYTYTDPVVYYEYMMDIAVLARDKGLKNVIVSSGFINAKPLKELFPLIDGANIDLKCFDDHVYQKLNGARLNPVLKALEMLNASEVWLEITNLLIPGWTDDMQTIRKMCDWLVEHGFEKVPLHFNRFVPAYKLNDSYITPVETLEKARQLAQDAGIKYIYIGNVHGGTYQNTYCPVCGSELVTRGVEVELVGMDSAGQCRQCNNRVDGVWW